MSELLEIQTFSTDRIEFAGVVFIVFFLLSAFFLSSCHSVTPKAQNQWIRNFRRNPVYPAAIQSSWRTQEKLLMVCMFGDSSPFHFDSVIPSLLCFWSCRGQTCKQPTFPYPELSCPGHVPEKLPTGNCSGILGWSQQETNLFLFWANFSLYDSPNVLLWFCRSCAGMSNIPVRAQGWESSESSSGAKLVLAPARETPELFRMDIYL